MNNSYDIIIIGAGLVGLSTGYQLKLKYPEKSLLILEKEDQVSAHQSGHNSGVIHSGIYYKPGSLKAKNCISGYKALIEFADQYAVPYEICGKIIVATANDELKPLQDIYERGVQNGLSGIQKLTKDQLAEYEPHVRGTAGLHVPQTGIIDYPFMAKKLKELLTDQLGGVVNLGEELMKIERNSIGFELQTTKASYTAKKVIACAGLQSDRVASFTEKENDLRIIPFRGEYFKLRPEKEHLIKNLVYPVPDPKFPFLGVHFTRMIGGGIEAGPNAVLAFKREGYRFKDFSLRDTAETFTWPGFWTIAGKFGAIGLGEMYRSISKAAFTKALQKLLPEITQDDLVPGGAGVRAQACDRKGNLLDDFNIVENDNLIHVRNAPSPAATSCLSIGKTISEMVYKN